MRRFFFSHSPCVLAVFLLGDKLKRCLLSWLQMVWENGCTVIVMMTALVEDGEKQCERYWPDEGSSLYHIYEVKLDFNNLFITDSEIMNIYISVIW